VVSGVLVLHCHNSQDINLDVMDSILVQVISVESKTKSTVTTYLCTCSETCSFICSWGSEVVLPSPNDSSPVLIFYFHVHLTMSALCFLDLYLLKPSLSSFSVTYLIGCGCGECKQIVFFFGLPLIKHKRGLFFLYLPIVIQNTTTILLFVRVRWSVRTSFLHHSQSYTVLESNLISHPVSIDVGQERECSYVYLCTNVAFNVSAVQHRTGTYCIVSNNFILAYTLAIPPTTSTSPLHTWEHACSIDSYFSTRVLACTHKILWQDTETACPSTVHPQYIFTYIHACLSIKLAYNTGSQNGVSNHRPLMFSVILRIRCPTSYASPTRQYVKAMPKNWDHVNIMAT
jgi:hypothetical protein